MTYCRDGGTEVQELQMTYCRDGGTEVQELQITYCRDGALRCRSYILHTAGTVY